MEKNIIDGLTLMGIALTATGLLTMAKNIVGIIALSFVSIILLIFGMIEISSKPSKS